jgi:RimJ/RimL family protein N-acetyltransferase
VRIPGLRGERVRLVPLDRALHLENNLVWFNDPEVTRWLKYGLPMMRLQEEKWFERIARSRRDVMWAIHDDSDRHIGGTGIHRIDWKNRNAVTGTVIGDPKAWGKGYGTDAMRTRTRWAFEELGLHRLQSECFVDNLASRRCLEKVGYRLIGTARQRFWRQGAWRDALLWEILDEDWFARAREGAAPSR